MFKKHQVVRLKQDDLLARGIDLKVLGQTSTKNRPFLVVACNKQMTWLVPLTTVIKNYAGRVKVLNKAPWGDAECEAVCSDLFSINTAIVTEIGNFAGKVTELQEVEQQLCNHIVSGRLG